MQITTLQLWSADVPALSEFYGRLLPGAAEVATDETLRLRVGPAQLVFKRAVDNWQGKYHFALRLPPQHLAAARVHVAGVTPLLRDATGNDQFTFESWGARSFYWRDPAGNIGELIAHGDAAPDDAPFETAMLSGVAEAGIAAADPHALADALRSDLGVATYHGSATTMRA
jgi:catechol-2,3-dioxygenase